MTQIGIVGLGWLGNALAKHLCDSGAFVWGTVTRIRSQQRIPQFQYIAGTTENLPPLDVAVIMIPFRRGLEDPSEYFDWIIEAVRCAIIAGALYIIWVGSVAVYSSRSGCVDELDIPDVLDSRQLVLRNIEESLSRLSVPALSIRMGGLFGPGRPIVNLLSKRTTPIADGPVNLIHQTDAVRIIDHAIRYRLTGTLNAVAPCHPMKSEVYPKWAESLGVKCPGFDSPKLQKIVSSRRLDELGFCYYWANPSDWLPGQKGEL